MSLNSYVQLPATGINFMDLDASKKFRLIRFLGLLGIRSAAHYPIPVGTIVYVENYMEVYDGNTWVRIT